jgi:hypothetical protein
MTRGDELEREAEARGWQMERCEPCLGTGIAKRPNINSATGYELSDPCFSCHGSGRVWSVRGCLPWRSDRELGDEFAQSRAPRSED